MAVTKRKTKKTKTAARKKKKAPIRRRRGPVHINYKCILRRCTARPKNPHIGPPGSMVELEAKNTDVEIYFTDGSPFEESRFSISEGEMITVEVVNGRGEYEYDLSCDKCKRTLAGPPSMIVD